MNQSPGIVLVSHSAQLAAGLRELLAQIASDRVPVAVAGGTDDGELGTSYERIVAAIAEADRGAVQVGERPGAARVIPAGGRVRVIRPLLAARIRPLLAARPAGVLTWGLALAWDLLTLTGSGVLILTRGLLARDVFLRRVGVLSSRSLGRLLAGLVRVLAVRLFLLMPVGTAHVRLRFPRVGVTRGSMPTMSNR